MQHPFDYTYLDWNMRKVGLASSNGATRLGMLWSYAFHCAKLGGVFCEVGVYLGGSSYTISDALETANSDVKFYMVDTFCGHPYDDAKESVHKARIFDIPGEKVPGIIKVLNGLRVGNEVKGGKIEDINFGDTKFAFVHVDTDTYQSVKYCLSYFWPKMMDRGIMVLDDPMFESCPGAKAALDESIPVLNLKPIVIPSKQVVLIKGLT